MGAGLTLASFLGDAPFRALHAADASTSTSTSTSTSSISAMRHVQRYPALQHLETQLWDQQLKFKVQQQQQAQHKQYTAQVQPWMRHMHRMLWMSAYLFACVPVVQSARDQHKVLRILNTQQAVLTEVSRWLVMGMVCFIAVSACRMCEWMGGVDGWRGGWKDVSCMGWMEGWMDEWMDGMDGER